MKRFGLRSTLFVVVLVGLAASTTVFAAGLTVTPNRLTVVGGTVPTTQPPGTSQTCTLDAVADSYADQTSVATVRGAAEELVVRSSSAGGNPRPPQNARAFVRFDMSACEIPSGASIESALLRLRAHQAVPGGQPGRTYEVRRVADSWGEKSPDGDLLTWSNMPGVAAEATSSVVTGIAVPVTLEWDVISDIDALLTDPSTNFGWRVIDTEETSTAERTFRFRSREYGGTTAADAQKAERPKLVITYVP